MDLVSFEGARRIIEDAHPVALPVGAFHSQGDSPGALILLTKPMKHDAAADADIRSVGGTVGAAELERNPGRCWNRVASNLKGILWGDGRDAACAGRYSSLGPALRACESNANCGGVTQDGGASCPPDYKRYRYQLRTSVRMPPSTIVSWVRKPECASTG